MGGDEEESGIGVEATSGWTLGAGTGGGTGGGRTDDVEVSAGGGGTGDGTRGDGRIVGVVAGGDRRAEARPWVTFVFLLDFCVLFSVQLFRLRASARGGKSGSATRSLEQTELLVALRYCALVDMVGDEAEREARKAKLRRRSGGRMKHKEAAQPRPSPDTHQKSLGFFCGTINVS